MDLNVELKECETVPNEEPPEERSKVHKVDLVWVCLGESVRIRLVRYVHEAYEDDIEAAPKG